VEDLGQQVIALPNLPRSSTVRLDIPGALLACGGMVGLVYGLGAVASDGRGRGLASLLGENLVSFPQWRLTVCFTLDSFKLTGGAHVYL
jgi:hypothetical protein